MSGMRFELEDNQISMLADICNENDWGSKEFINKAINLLAALTIQKRIGLKPAFIDSDQKVRSTIVGIFDGDTDGVDTIVGKNHNFIKEEIVKKKKNKQVNMHIRRLGEIES